MTLARRHAAFLISLGLGVLVAVATLALPVMPEFRALMAADVGFACYVGLMLYRAGRITAQDLRRHSDTADEGLPLILTLALVALGASIAAILLVLNAGKSSNLATDLATDLALRLMALAAVPLGWAMLQILIGYHYAQVFYRARSGGGLEFPGTKTPGVWDFLYFSFGVAMTAQVSDVVITTTAMRRMVSLHAVFSYFYNAGILALAVNAALAAAH